MAQLDLPFKKRYNITTIIKRKGDDYEKNYQDDLYR